MGLMRIVIFLKDPDSLVIIDWLRTGNLMKLGQLQFWGPQLPLRGAEPDQRRTT